MPINEAAKTGLDFFAYPASGVSNVLGKFVAAVVLGMDDEALVRATVVVLLLDVAGLLG